MAAPQYFIPPPDSDIELKKATVNHLIETLDEAGIWNLAAVLHSRGLLQRNIAGLDPASQQGSTRQTFSLAELVPPTTSSAEAFGQQGYPPGTFLPPPAAPCANPTPHMGDAAAPIAPLQQVVAQMFAPSTQNELSSPATEPVSRTTNAPPSDTKTTIIIRNLPSHVDQTSGRSWLDKSGYAGLYDFFLWFPPKQTKRVSNYGYALVNFRSEDVAERFLSKFHGTKVLEGEGNEKEEDEDAILNITFANVQGFVQNYERFSAICDEPHTKCAPFFASDALRKYGIAGDTRASQNTKGGHETTIVIRNLPTSVDTQDKARLWLDDFGYAKKYDFLLYLPPKKNRNSTKKCYGYMFVNFGDSADATACTSALHGMPTCESMPKLNVASSKIQGFEGCKTHFASLADSESCKPWVGEVSESTQKGSEGTSFSFQ
eukprot:TRINITY_DN12516_c1_g4_i1.p1 TRINITY_DN12516_c1_g4~~TRINITY_DN12516_c1_g4_i1.p1  ORF type:complete len:431 (-),score=66.30 TRINITY_DN12516_c1_g4_i1:111-1403(-)